MAIHLSAGWGSDRRVRVRLLLDTKLSCRCLVLDRRREGRCRRTPEKGPDRGKVPDVEKGAIEGGVTGYQDLACILHDGCSVGPKPSSQPGLLLRKTQVIPSTAPSVALGP